MSIFRKNPKNPFDEFKGRPLDEVPPDIRSKSACLKMFIWVKACLLSIHADSELALSPRAKLAVDIFFLGSIDYLCQCHRLDDKWFGVTVDEIFCTINSFSELSGVTLFINYNNFLNFDFSRKVLDDGGSLCQKWFSRENPDAPMALWSFVKEWNETPEPPNGLEKKDLLRYFWDHGGSQFTNNVSG